MDIERREVNYKRMEAFLRQNNVDPEEYLDDIGNGRGILMRQRTEEDTEQEVRAWFGLGHLNHLLKPNKKLEAPKAVVEVKSDVSVKSAPKKTSK